MNKTSYVLRKHSDDAKKISKLNAPGFNRLVVVWKA